MSTRTTGIYLITKPDFNQAKAKILGLGTAEAALAEIEGKIDSSRWKYLSKQHILDFFRDLENSSSWDELIQAMTKTLEDLQPMVSVGIDSYLIRESYHAYSPDDYDAAALLLLWATPLREKVLVFEVAY